ncbi:protoporphyrinogen/coproporphyrinogen oxidase [Mucilaginibacter phyllosphaerae]
MKVAIIGAGPTGLTTARQLSEHGIQVDVYDNAPTVGGFAKSIELWGQKVEIGPHFIDLGNIPAVHDLVLEALDGNYTTYQRKTFILAVNNMFCYPPVINDVIKKLSFPQLCLAAFSLMKQTVIKRKENGTAEAFVVRRLGNRLYKLFFSNFSKKLWGLNGSQVSDVFARSLLGFNDTHSPIKLALKKLKLGSKAKVDQSEYIYPRNGLSTLWESLQTQTEMYGGKFYLSAPIKELVCSSIEGNISHLILKDGTVREYDFFISTIPILPLISYLKTQDGFSIKPGASINFRCDILIYIKAAFDSAIDGQCFYSYAEESRITRVTNFNKFGSGIKPKFSVLLVEFWCGKEDDIWLYDEEELLKTAVCELEKTNIFKGLKILDKHIKKIENAFQIPNIGLLEGHNKLLNQLSVYKNLKVTGRNASVSFNYGMENAINDGIILADQLLSEIKEDSNLVNV